MDSTSLQSLLGTGLSLGGIGLALDNQQQQYNGLQNALNTIGPTNLNGYSLSGPGGMSAGYNANGGIGIDLGSLSPAYGNLSAIGGMGSGSYSPALLAGLTGNASGILPAATSNVNSAFGNYNNALGAANTQLGALGQTYSDVFNNTLSSLQAQQAPQVQQQAFGLQNTLFGKGALDMTGAGSGAISAANFGSQVNAMNAQNNLTAQQQALSAQNAGVNNYAQLSNSANGILSGALSNFGNTNSLISGLNSAQLNNSLSALSGAGALNTLGLNNYNAALGTGSAQATARNQSLFPYASTASTLAGTPNALTLLGRGLTQAGASFGGVANGIAGLFGNSGGLNPTQWANDYGSTISSQYSPNIPYNDFSSAGAGSLDSVGIDIPDTSLSF